MKGSRSLDTRRRGFTLIEVVVVLTMLVMVLFTAYKILNNCLESERMVERMTMPQKVGEALISVMRRDISGAFYKGMTSQLENQFFIGLDSETADGPQDQLVFLTTVKPTPWNYGSAGESTFFDDRSTHNVTVVSYRLEANQVSNDYQCYSLIRKEVADFSGGSPLDEVGFNIVLYDKVKSLNIDYYDPGHDDPNNAIWLPEWSSEQEIASIEAEIDNAAALAENQPQRIGRVSDTETQGGMTQGEIDPALGATEELVSVRSPLPAAVRVQIEIYGGLGDKIWKKGDEPVVETFSTVIPLLAAQRMNMQFEDLEGDLAAGGGAMGEDGEDGVFGNGGGQLGGIRAGGGREGGGRGGGRAGGGRAGGGRAGNIGRTGGGRAGSVGRAGGGRAGGGRAGGGRAGNLQINAVGRRGGGSTRSSVR